MPLYRRRAPRRTNPVRRKTTRYRRPYVRKNPTGTSRKPYSKVMRLPVADKVYTRLRYSDGISFTCTLADTIYPYTYQTSIYDPDLSGVGHQPMWRDMYAAQFNRYRVNGIAYKIYVKNTNAVNMAIFLVQHSSVTTTDTNINTALERNATKRVYLDSPSNKSNIIKGYLNVAKVFGLSRQAFTADDQYDALVTANPAKMGYLHLMALGRAPAILNVQVELTYYVEFFDRYMISGS